MKKIAATCGTFLVLALMLGYVPAAPAAPPANSIVLVNDLFADGERTTQALPDSIALFKGLSTTTASASPGAATFTYGATGADFILANFTPSGSPVSLGVGDALTVQLTVSFTGLNPVGIPGTQAAGVRFGVFDSQGSRVEADVTSNNQAAFIGDTGYALFTPFYQSPPTTVPTAFDHLRRTTLTAGNLFSTGSNFTSIGSSGTPPNFVDATDYTLVYRIARLSATETQLYASVTGGALDETYNFAVTETSATPNTAFDYFIWRVQGQNFAAAVTFKAVEVDLTLVPPAITLDPIDQTAGQGSTATFSAAATGSALTLQWLKDGVAIPGANAATLTVVNAQPSDEGSYSFTATNVLGTATSAAATLTVTAAGGGPIITSQPVSQTVEIGGDASFSVTATGVEPLSYQWLKNGTPVDGAILDTLDLTSVQLSDAGLYRVGVTDATGTSYSTPAALNVTVTGALGLVNDSFADGERATYAPPDTVGWYKCQGATTAGVVPGALTFTYGATSADMHFAFFSAAGSPVSLSVGDKLSLKLTFAFTGLNATANSAVRFGILDSKGTRITADSTSTSNAIYAGDTGYGLFIPFSTAASSAAAFDLKRRTTLTATNVFNTGGDFTTIGSGGAAQVFANDTDYTLTYTIERVSDTQTRLTAGVTGGALGDAYSYSAVETSATPNTTFDWFGWRMGSMNFSAATTFKNLTVDLTLSAPTITTQPLSQSGVEGDTIVLTAAVSGSAPLTFQWSKDGAPIVGATTTTLTLTDVLMSDSGAYTLTATNAAGTVTSNVAAVVIGPAPPTITVQPEPQMILVGDPVTFSVGVSGTAPFSYQWLKDGVPIPGAIAETFTIASLVLADSGDYSVTVTNDGGSATSNPAELLVTTEPVPPSFRTLPASLTVIEGQPASFSVSASGTTPLGYQWHKDTVDIGGATAATYTIPATAAADAGSYTVTVTNTAGTATSDPPAVLTVLVPPTIVTPPAPQVVNAGAPASFSVVVAGTPPFSYQWLKSGVAISGATSDTLSFAAAQAADAAAYSVVVTNAAGTITSATATLTVVDPGLTVSAYFPAQGATGLPIDAPLKVTFSVTPTLGTAGTIRIIDTATSAVVDTIDLAAATQTKTIGGATYKYYPVIITGSTALITPHVALAYAKTYAVRLDRGTFKTAVGVFDGIDDDATWTFSTKAAGPAAGTTSLVVSADGTADFATVQGAIDFVPSANTIRRFVFIKSGTYQELIRISNRPLITLHGQDRKATIIQYANNDNFNPGSSARTVLAAETADTTIENLTVHNLTPKGGSQAEAIRTNGARSILRDLDLKSFQDTLQLNGSAFVENTYIEGDVDFLWGNAAAYFVNCELKELSSSGYIVQARNPSGQHGFVFVDCRLTRASTQTGDFLARIDPAAYPYSEVVYVDNAMGPHIAPAGWRFDSAASTANIRFCEHGSTDLIGDPLDVSQRIAGSCQLTAEEAALYRDPAYVLGGWAPETLPVIEVQPASQTVSVGQTAVLSVAATGRPAPTYQWQKDTVDIAGATSSTLILVNAELTDAGLYTVVASNSAGSVTSAPATLVVTADPDAPVIVTPPADQTVAVGGTATFSVTAAGAPVLAYQWARNGVAIAGATSPTLALGAVQIAQAGFYSVTVSNAIGSVTSVPALLSVQATPIPAAPTIQTQPLGQTAIVGETVTLSVAASGIPTPTYQWFKDGVPIDGATGASLALADVQTTDSGAYAVVVTNPLGSVTSDDAVLTVLERPRLISFTSRGRDGSGGQHLTTRFVIQGATPKTVLIRVAGPALRAEGEIAFLRDPKLILSSNGLVIARNDNWWTASGDIAGATTAVGATPFAARSKDAALLITLDPGAYVVDAGTGIGVCRVEVYEVPADDDTSRLVANTTGAYLLTRLFEVDGTFTVGGDTPGLVLVRALGPALAHLGVRNSLDDPRLTLYSGSTVVAENDNWGTNPDVETLKGLFTRVGASALSAGSKDAALAVTLSPGTYRAHVAGPRRTSAGRVSLEIYEVGGLAITSQPLSQTVDVGTAATFTVAASGAAPITYQWRKNGADIPGATGATLTLPDAQPADAGAYSVLVSNPTDEILSAAAILTLTSPATLLPPIPTFDLEGFATMAGGVTGGGLVDPADTTRYKIIDASTPDPAQTLKTYLESADPLVIELRTDVDLGVLHNQSRTPLINPELIASGLGVIRPASNKTLFSANAATLRHGGFTISAASNIIIRNLRFQGLWEWDDATQGAYDLQSWDYVTIQTGSRNIWIDHCEFGKSYDGLIDVVHGSDMVTVSWSRFSGDLGTEVTNQINYLESLYQANPADSRIAYYKTLRDAGQTVADIIAHEIPQDKGSLVGNGDDLAAEDSGRLNVTFHHNAYVLVRQRTPRMRFGNAHVYNVLVDDAASALLPGTQTAVNSTMNAAVLVENSYFLEVKTPYAFSGGGRVSDRGGSWQYGGVALPFEPARLNPVDPDALVWNPPLGFAWTDLTTLPYSYTLDPVDYTLSNPGRIGVIAPANALDEALLRSYLPMTSH